MTRPDWLSSPARPSESLWLDKNENLDPDILTVSAAVLRGLDPMCVAIYPDLGNVYRKLGEWVGVPPESILLTPGSDGAIRLVFEAFAGDGVPVVHTAPSFAMYTVYSLMFGVKAIPVAYTRSARGPVLDLAHVKQVLRNTKPQLFCLPNPDSPTGTAVPKAKIRELASLCRELGSVMLIDEAYHPFLLETCVDLTGEFENVIVARTFSKAWGLAGVRVGYAVGNPDTIRFLNKLRPMYEVGALSVAMIEGMLDNASAMETSVRTLQAGMVRLKTAMEALGYGVLPTHGNFIHVEFGDRAEVVHAALDGIVLYRKSFNVDCLAGYSRFSATTVQKFTPVIDRIAAVS